MVGAMWTGKRTPLMDCFVQECHRRARYLEEGVSPDYCTITVGS
jgi:hypothetical protein